MERSLAGRGRVGRIDRPFAPPAARRAARSRARARGAPPPRSRRLALRIEALPGGRALRAIWRRRRLRIALVLVVLLSGSLPSVEAGRVPASGQRVSDASASEALSVLGAAPAPLAGLVMRAYTGASGLTVVLRHGLSAYFGDASRPHAKWSSLALVLASPLSTGATYID